MELETLRWIDSLLNILSHQNMYSLQNPYFEQLFCENRYKRQQFQSMCSFIRSFRLSKKQLYKGCSACLIPPHYVFECSKSLTFNLVQVSVCFLFNMCFAIGLLTRGPIVSSRSEQLSRVLRSKTYIRDKSNYLTNVLCQLFRILRCIQTKICKNLQNHHTAFV